MIYPRSKTRPTKILYLAETRARDFIKTQSPERTARRPRLSSTIGRSMLPNSQQWSPRPYINGPCPYIFAGCHYIVLREESGCARGARVLVGVGTHTPPVPLCQLGSRTAGRTYTSGPGADATQFRGWQIGPVTLSGDD